MKKYIILFAIAIISACAVDFDLTYNSYGSPFFPGSYSNPNLDGGDASDSNSD